jgi:hypothetical protein
MKGFLITVLILLLFTGLHAQTAPDSIIIKTVTYQHAWEDTVHEDSLIGTKTYKFIKHDSDYMLNGQPVFPDQVEGLLDAVNDPDNSNNDLGKYGIDTAWIKQNPEKILHLLPDSKYYDWNPAQKALIDKALTNIKSYIAGLNNYLKEGCCYSMHQWYRYQLEVSFYSKGQLTNRLTSRMFSYGFAYPWTDMKGQQLFNVNIEKSVNQLLNVKQRREIPDSKKLLQKLANDILQINEDSLHKLAALSYAKEIGELKKVFTVVSAQEITGYGAYWGDGHKMQIILHNDQMPPNFDIEFIASKTGNTIYSRDSVMLKYKSAVDRVKAINFIRDYLAAHPKKQLHIVFFDNLPVNNYNIDDINKDPKQWKMYDDELKSFQWDKEHDIKLSFDVEDSKKVAEHLYCGCDLRLPDSVMRRGIIFIIDDDDKNHSRWLLLPDNRVLAFFAEGHEFMDQKTTRYLFYPCSLYDLDGHPLPKPEFPAGK